MTAPDESAQQRVEKAADLAVKVRRFKIETRFLYAIAIGLAVFVLHLHDQLAVVVDHQAKQATAQRRLVERVDQQRQDLAQAVRDYTEKSCKVGNALRVVLRGIVVKGRADLLRLVNESPGLLTATQVDRALASSRASERALKGRNCKVVKSSIPAPTRTP